MEDFFDIDTVKIAAQSLDLQSLLSEIHALTKEKQELESSISEDRKKQYDSIISIYSIEFLKKAPITPYFH